MPVFLVWSGDGYGHNSLLCITADEERAQRESEPANSWYEREDLQDLGKGLDAWLRKGER